MEALTGQWSGTGLTEQSARLVDPIRAWLCPGDDHVLSQPWAVPHIAAHRAMLGLGWRSGSRWSTLTVSNPPTSFPSKPDGNGAAQVRLHVRAGGGGVSPCPGSAFVLGEIGLGGGPCNTRSMARVGMWRCLVAAVLFGTSAPAASRLAGEVPTLALAGMLYLGAGLAVLPWVLRSPPTVEAMRQEWRRALVAVVAGGAIGPALLVAGLARTSAASASILLNLELAATVVLAATVFREHLGGRVIAGAVLVTGAGVVLGWQPGTDLSVGALFIAGACVAWGFDNGVTAKIDQLSPELVVLLKGFIAGSTNLVLGVTVGAGLGGIGTVEVLAALVVGAAGYGASIVLWVKGARDLGAARGQVIFATAPFIGAVLAWVVLRDPVTGAQIIAGLLAAVGVAVSLESAHDHEHTHREVAHEHEHDHGDGHHDHHHDEPVAGRHTHSHRHRQLVHAHPHVPDLHHRHH